MYFNQIRMQLGGETALIAIQGGQLLQESKDKSLQPLSNEVTFFRDVKFSEKSIFGLLIFI